MNQDLWRQPLSAPELLLAPRWTLLPEGPQADWAVHVAGGRFAAVGPAEELARRLPQLQPLALPQTLLMPGFVDAHHHLTQSFGEPSEIFRRIWVPLEASLDERALYVAAKLASLEALCGGFTTVCDAGTRAQGGLEAIARATVDTGLRCVLGLSCNDRGSAQPPEAILNQAQRFLNAWPADGLVHPSLAIPIAEAATDPMLREVSQRGMARCTRSTSTSTWPRSSARSWRAACARSSTWTGQARSGPRPWWPMPPCSRRTS